MIFETDVIQKLNGQWRGEIYEDDALLYWDDFDTKEQAELFCVNLLAEFLTIEESLN